MPPKFKVSDRVRCLATRFDAGSEDRNGDVFSVRQRRLGHGEYCFGTVKWVHSSKRGEQKYRVLWDGDATLLQSGETHLEPEVDIDNVCGNMSELGGNSATTIFVVRVLHV